MFKKLLLAISLLFLSIPAQAGWVNCPIINIIGGGTSTINENNTDLGFGSGTVEFPHWIGTATTNGTATFWTKIPSLPPGNTTINMYYNGTALIGSFSTVFTKDYGESGLGGLWHFDEGSGSTTALDSSGNGNIGTLTNMEVATDWQSTDGGQWDGRAGVIFNKGSHLDFDGTNEDVVVTHSNSVSPTSSMTISIWAKASELNTVQVLTEKRPSGGANTTFLCYKTAGNQICFSINGAVDVLSTTAVPLDTWFNVTVTYNKVNLRIYYNGVLEDTDALTVDLLQNTTSLLIGGSIDYTFWKGKIDEYRLYYNRVLSQPEIAAYSERRKYQGTATITVSYGVEQTNPGIIYTQLNKMRTVTINNSGSALTDFQVEVPVRIGVMGGQEIKD